MKVDLQVDSDNYNVVHKKKGDGGVPSPLQFTTIIKRQRRHSSEIPIKQLCQLLAAALQQLQLSLNHPISFHLFKKNLENPPKNPRQKRSFNLQNKCHFRVIFVSFLCHFCVIFVRFQCHYDARLISFQCHFCVIFVSFQCHSTVFFCEILVSLRCQINLNLVSFQCLFCVILVSLRCQINFILVSFQCHFSVILVSFQCHSSVFFMRFQCHYDARSI